jgi:hypothetical protein
MLRFGGVRGALISVAWYCSRARAYINVTKGSVRLRKERWNNRLTYQTWNWLGLHFSDLNVPHILATRHKACSPHERLEEPTSTAEGRIKESMRFVEF